MEVGVGPSAFESFLPEGDATAVRRSRTTRSTPSVSMSASGSVHSSSSAVMPSGTRAYFDAMLGSSRSSTSFGIASAGMEGLSLSSSASTSASASSASTATTNRSAVDTKEQARKRNILGVIKEHPKWDVTSEDVENDIERASEIVKSLQQQSIKKVMRLLKAAQNLSVAFVVDTTGSMDAHITGVKDQIRAMVKEISKQRVKMNFAFVGYKDHCDGADHFEVLPFTKDIAVFQRFLDGITATGDGDQAEDVLGGLMQALTSSSGTNMLRT